MFFVIFLKYMKFKEETNNQTSQSKYRLGLSRKIQAEPDNEKRRHLLSEAQQTDYYKNEAIKHIETREVEVLKRQGIEFGILKQGQAPWVQFENDNINENHERKTPTPEQVEKMDERLKELGKIFAGSNINWHLDGALNISLLNGEYIGNHKDVDLSVERSELKEFESQLFKNGYGLFLSQSENAESRKTMRRVGYKNFRDSKTEHPIIAAIDKYGKILENKALNHIDAHIIERNSNGSPLGVSGAVIPEKWAKPYPIEFKGEQINLSHPGKVLYYKLHQGRNYDETDIKKLIETGKLKEEDVDDIEAVYKKEEKENIKFAFNIFDGVTKKITPGMNNNNIFEILKQEPALKEREEIIKQPEEKQDFLNRLQLLAEEVFKSEDKSAEIITNLAIEIFDVNEKNLATQEGLSIIRQKVVDLQELKSVRNNLESMTLLNKRLSEKPKIEFLGINDLAENYQKQYEFLKDERLNKVTISVVPDELWVKGAQPSESQAEKGIISIKESYFKTLEKPDEIAWLTHELAHCQNFLDSGSVENYQKNQQTFAFVDLKTEFAYPNNIVEQAAFTKQFEFLKSQGKSRTNIMDMIGQYYNQEDFPFFDRLLDDIYKK